MGTLFSSLRVSAGALAAFQQALEITQNNVSNASTPGYARQSIHLEALPVDPARGLPGGVSPGEIRSARDRYAEDEVRRQLQNFGYHDQMSAILASIEASFDVSGEQGIPGALNGLFKSFSGWSADPNNPALRESVLESSRAVAQSFQGAAADIVRASGDIQQKLQTIVAEINAIGAKLQTANQDALRSPRADAAVDASVHEALEQLSELVNFSVLPQADGTVTVLLGGQTPLVAGGRQYPLTLTSNGAQAVLQGPDGEDVTTQITGGRLGALLEIRNEILPSLQGAENGAGGLDRLAKGLADTINGLLEQGSISEDPDRLPGVALFTYDEENPGGIASSLALNPDITPDQLAAISADHQSNGNAIELAALGTARDRIDGAGFVEFYGLLAGKLGRQASDANGASVIGQQLVAQARSARDRISGVSLDEEAVHLIEFQRAYQAAAQLISVLNDLTETAVNLLR